MLLLAALDLLARFVLGQDLVRLAGEGAVPRAVRAPEAPTPAEEPLVTTVESTRYTILAMAPAGCARGPTCDVTLSIEPTRGRHLVPYGPYAFLPAPSTAFTFDHAPGKILAKERTPSRAVITLPVRLGPVREGADAIDGKIRVVTCDAATCTNDILPIAIAVPPRTPTG